jgi:hypothetical protein
MMMMMTPLLGCPTLNDDPFVRDDDDDDDDGDDDDFVDDLVFGDPCLSLDPTDGELHNWFEGEAAGYQLGWAVVGLEDIDGDGLGEIAFSARQWDGDTNAGRVYVFFSSTLGGGEGLDLDEADVILQSPNVSRSFGHSLAALDDIDRDDKPELMVGAAGGSGTAQPSVAYLFTSTQLLADDEYDSDDAHTTIVTDITTLELGLTNPGIGSLIISLGNLDDHPSAEVAIGAAAWPEEDVGVIAIFSGEVLDGGGELDLVDAHVLLFGSVSRATVGGSMANVGDVTGDGYDDLLIGSWNLNEPDLGVNDEDGVVWFFSGGPLFASGGDWLTSDADTVIVGGDRSGGNLGISLTAIGDYDHDGVPDFAIGEPQSSHISPGDGFTRIWSGATFTNSLYDSVDADISIAGAGSEAFGTALSGAGDLNGDGEPDLLIAAPNRNRAGVQAAGVVYIARSSDLESMDSAALSADLKHKLCGATVGERIGQTTGTFSHPSRAVAIVPDVDGDGLDDILIGASMWTTNSGNLSTGRVYLVLSRFVPVEPDDVGDDDDSAEAE